MNKSLPVFILLVVSSSCHMADDCWYENNRHEEGVQVLTNEPCLNCTCSRGALLCYLRVCPRLPNPPPTGCILLHRFNSCCPELICSDIPSGNSIEGRSELDPTEDLLSQSSIDGTPDIRNACVSNGSIYAPGSAMDTSTDCEYCFCIGGSQKCIRPKCLLPLDGCAPSYDANDCCPSRYNCTHDFFTTTTTTLAPKEYETQGGCIVDSDFYPEGGKVLRIGHSACDNCYCLRGLVRCEPLSCASPLLGCTPVIKTGECCAASYNCSGAIETQPEPNYGQFPTVSKEYAKLRKEVQHKRTTTPSKAPPAVINAVPYYVIAESTKSEVPGLKDQKTGSESSKDQKTALEDSKHQKSGQNTDVITQNPFYYNFTGNKSDKIASVVYPGDNIGYKKERGQQQPEIYYVATKVAASNADIYREDSLATTIRHKKYTSSSEVKQIQNLLEERIIRGIVNQSVTETPATSEIPEIPTTTFEQSTMLPTTASEIEGVTSSTLINDRQTETEQTSVTEMDIDLSTLTTLHEDNGETSTPFMQLVEMITMRTVSNSTDCITINSTAITDNDLEQNENRHGVDYEEVEAVSIGATEAFVTDTYGTTTDFDGTTHGDPTENTATMSTHLNRDNNDHQANTATLPANTKFALQNILNLNKTSADYDYDYNGATLPPSLPNLRIIPFVAADAVDSKSDNLKTSNHLYQENKSFPFNNQFSPPAQTEGGFVPKEPPVILIDRFYEVYHTTNIGSNPNNANGEIGGITVMPPMPALTNPPKTDENNCIVDTKEVGHGESVRSEGNCALCACFYGSIVCHEPQCPIPQIGCRNSNKIDRSTCCPEIICDIDESPTVVLDSTDNTSKLVITVADPVTPADPFRDVIRTEPAPDLQLLIGDMSNYLMKQSTTSSPAPSTAFFKPGDDSTAPSIMTTQAEENDLSFNKIWDMLFSNEDSRTSPGSTTRNGIFITPPTTINSISTTQSGDRDLQQSPDFVETRESINTPLAGLSWMTAAVTKRQEHVPNLLKLAGCNIYGRMYRVGRIISELSGPCMECKCTEVGVQCENLTC